MMLSNVQQLNRNDIKKLEEYWQNYKAYKKQLQFRRWELLNPHVSEKEQCETRAPGISKPTERDAMRLQSDELYSNLERIIKTMETLYENADEDIRKIIEMRYWDENGFCYEWEDIADQLYLSRNKVLRRRNVLLDEMAKRIGWV